MKNIVILTKTLTRYHHISSSLSKLSEGFLKTSNTFIPVKTLIKFKMRSFYQIFFQDTDLLIIDHEIEAGKDLAGKKVNLLDKIKNLNVVNINTKILVLIISNFEEDLKPFETFVFTENAKAESFMPKLLSEVLRILEK